MEKRSNVTFKVTGTKLEATLFLTNEDLKAHHISPDAKMGTSYGLNWHECVGGCPTPMRTEGPEKLPEGVSWKYTGEFEDVPWYDILEFETGTFPVYISEKHTVSVDYSKWMEEDTRPKQCYRYQCVERVICDGYVWACSEKQAKLLVRDYVTGVCEYQDEQISDGEWESDGIECSVNVSQDKPGSRVTVIGKP